MASLFHFKRSKIFIYSHYNNRNIYNLCSDLASQGINKVWRMMGTGRVGGW